MLTHRAERRVETLCVETRRRSAGDQSNSLFTTGDCFAAASTALLAVARYSAQRERLAMTLVTSHKETNIPYPPY